MRAMLFSASIVAAFGVAAYWFYKAEERGAVDLPATIAGDIEQGMMDMVKIITGWSVDKVPAEYRAAIVNAENAHGLPAGMLARLLYQESHYRQDIITGKTRSPAGALGIAQFMPATAAELGINPLEPYQSIDAAARYLARLYRSTGDWKLALAAYNWGIGNVQRKGIAVAPRETVAYYSGILSDIGMA